MSINDEIDELTSTWPGLKLIESSNDGWSVQGHVNFDALYPGLESIADSFYIKIEIPSNYPINLPIVKEVDNRIGDFKHINENKTFCLGARFEIRRKFNIEPTLSGYVDNIIIPFLYSYCYFEKHGKMPYGELSHYGEGVLEYYKELFELDNNNSVLACLESLYKNGYSGQKKCPCGSGKRARKCHKVLFRNILEYHNQDELLKDIVEIKNYLS